jgi:hypothetical protein
LNNHGMHGRHGKEHEKEHGKKEETRNKEWKHRGNE